MCVCVCVLKSTAMVGNKSQGKSQVKSQDKSQDKSQMQKKSLILSSYS